MYQTWLYFYIWVAQHELLTSCCTCIHPQFLVRSMLLICLIFCIVLCFENVFVLCLVSVCPILPVSGLFSLVYPLGLLLNIYSPPVTSCSHDWYSWKIAERSDNKYKSLLLHSCLELPTKQWKTWLPNLNFLQTMYSLLRHKGFTSPRTISGCLNQWIWQLKSWAYVGVLDTT